MGNHERLDFLYQPWRSNCWFQYRIIEPLKYLHSQHLTLNRINVLSVDHWSMFAGYQKIPSYVTAIRELALHDDKDKRRDTTTKTFQEIVFVAPEEDHSHLFYSIKGFLI